MMELEHIELLHLEILTLSRVHESGIAAHASAPHLCVLHRSGAEPLHVWFASFSRILEFITEMNPRTASVEGGRYEDVTALNDVLGEAMIQSMPAPLISLTLH
jgi:hypothetical protein